MSDKNNDYEKVKERYMELFALKHFKRTNTIEMMQSKICKKEQEMEGRRQAYEHYKFIRDIYVKVFGNDADYYFRIDCSMTKSTLLRYFTPKQIALFKSSRVKNPVVSSAKPMKIYSLNDIIRGCYEHKIKPRNEFKPLNDWGMVYADEERTKRENEARAKKISSIDEVINAYKKTLQG